MGHLVTLNSPVPPEHSRDSFLHLMLTRVSFFFWCSEPWALTLVSVFLSAKCGLPTYYEDEMPLLGAVDEPHWGQVTIDVVVRPGIFYFYFIFFAFLIIMLSYIFLSCKPTTTTTTRYYCYEP